MINNCQISTFFFFERVVVSLVAFKTFWLFCHILRLAAAKSLDLHPVTKKRQISLL